MPVEYEPVIGLEVHAQLATQSKIFCGCSAKFGATPNTHGCPVCLGMPGSLPVLNRRAVDLAVRISLSVGCAIQPRSRFLRKNYFYPDLPKGYQVSQYQSQDEMPLATGGGVEIEGEGTRKAIRLIRIHMEEDAGKLIHDEAFVGKDESLFDVNRCGVPLIEIVSEPDLASPEEAYLYLTKLRQILVYTGVSEGHMEAGNIRIDANVSVRPKGTTGLGTKVEIKNMNSLRNTQRALEVEIARQVEILEGGGRVAQETLLFDAEAGVVVPMRSKEESQDYRYFPEPDLVPIEVDAAWIERVRGEIPELPEAKRARLVQAYGLPPGTAEVLALDRAVADYFEAAVKAGADARQTANWVTGDVLRALNIRQVGISDFPVKADQLAEMIRLMDAGTISGKIAKTVFEEMVKTGKDARKIVEEQGLTQISDAGALEATVEQVIAAHPQETERYRNGEQKLLAFFVGQVMKATRGKANPGMVNQLLKEKLAGK